MHWNLNPGICLDFGYWNLFGIWIMDFGISLLPVPANYPTPTPPLKGRGQGGVHIIELQDLNRYAV